VQLQAREENPMQNFTHESGLFSYRIEGEVAILRAEKSVIEIAVDLDAKESFFSTFSEIEQSPKIRALVLTHSSDALSDDIYRRFILSMVRAARSGVFAESTIDLQREMNAISQFVLSASAFRKVLVSCLHGRVASSFFGAHLSGDIRIASEDLVVEMSHIALGIPPDGGLGFFLPRYVGQGLATEILLSGDPLPAQRALDLGLVHAIVPTRDFDANCLDVARRFLTVPAATVPYTKETLAPRVEDLKDYLKAQVSATIRAIAVRSST